MKIAQWSMATALCSIMLVGYLPLTMAQQPDPKNETSARTAAPQREGGILRSEMQQEQGDDQQGTEEGMPRTRAVPGRRSVPEAQLAPDDQRLAPQWQPPDRHRWKLGVYASNTDTGVVVTQVIPGSPARDVGLERGDRIVAVGGFQVGWVDDRLYPLGAELQRQAGHNGRAKLLVQNVRNRNLLTLDVHLEGRHDRRARIQDAGLAQPLP
ncbi:PDZ domain-containing protein [Stieleria magnilauensis]|uniref:PDZ domain (Also known as DHR or GLGF) n=1 Tax=Stieleria magnilauensis TaxID=2527963 RepID=A0ABX5XXB4_9BACT|nr:PDZ domain (Also known as DHR or GLGF) [Planctomycetes bacterium TBK1r]